MARHKKAAIDKGLAKTVKTLQKTLSTKSIADYLGVTSGTVGNIAGGKSGSTDVTRERLTRLADIETAHVAETKAANVARSRDKSLSPMARALARGQATDAGRAKVHKKDAPKREEFLPHISTAQFLEYYSKDKTDKQRQDESARFAAKGVCTSIGDKVVFSSKPLYPSTKIHVRGTVYANSFNTGFNQIVRDLHGTMFPGGQTLDQGVAQGEGYFNACFQGDHHLEVASKFKKTRDDAIVSRYQALEKWLAERIYLGVYLYQ